MWGQSNRTRCFVLQVSNDSLIMFLKILLIFIVLISVVFSEIDDEESFVFITKQALNRFITQNKELTIKCGLYQSCPA